MSNESVLGVLLCDCSEERMECRQHAEYLRMNMTITCLDFFVRKEKTYLRQCSGWTVGGIRSDHVDGSYE